MSLGASWWNRSLAGYKVVQRQLNETLLEDVVAKLSNINTIYTIVTILLT